MYITETSYWASSYLQILENNVLEKTFFLILRQYIIFYETFVMVGHISKVFSYGVIRTETHTKYLTDNFKCKIENTSMNVYY